MVATRFHQDLSIPSRHKAAAAAAQRLANSNRLPVTLRLRPYGAELIYGIVTGPQTITYLPED